METDPFHARRTGVRRLRLVTASIGAAAVVGTGALAWSVAADTTTTTAAASSPTTTTGDTFAQSSQLPRSSSGSPTASSGGS